MKLMISALFSTVLFFGAVALASSDQGGLPKCQAELIDEVNSPVKKIEWREELFIGSIDGASKAVLISTSLGNNKVMSLWVREKTERTPYGMFSFLDLSTGREHSMRFYMADRFSVAVTCRWDADSRRLD